MTEGQQPQVGDVGACGRVTARRTDIRADQPVDLFDERTKLGRRHPQPVAVIRLGGPPIRRLLWTTRPGATRQLLVSGQRQVLDRECRGCARRRLRHIRWTEFQTRRRRPPRALCARPRTPRSRPGPHARAPAGDSCNSKSWSRAPSRTVRPSADRTTSSDPAAPSAADGPKPAAHAGRSPAPVVRAYPRM